MFWLKGPVYVISWNTSSQTLKGASGSSHLTKNFAIFSQTTSSFSQKMIPQTAFLYWIIMLPSSVISSFVVAVNRRDLLVSTSPVLGLQACQPPYMVFVLGIKLKFTCKHLTDSASSPVSMTNQGTGRLGRVSDLSVREIDPLCSIQWRINYCIHTYSIMNLQGRGRLKGNIERWGGGVTH